MQVYLNVKDASGADNADRAVIVYVPVKTTGVFNIFAHIMRNGRRAVVFEDTVEDLSSGMYSKKVALPPGSYTLDVSVKDLATGQTSAVAREFQVEYAQSQAGKQVAAPAQASERAASAPPAIYYEVNPAKPPSDLSRLVTIYIPLKASSKLNIFCRITTSTRRRVSVFEDTVSGLGGDVYSKVVPLAPGTYTLDVVTKDLTTNEATTTTQEIRVDGAR
jgi:hypothetical protein